MLQKEKPYVIQWKYGEDDGGGCSYKVGDGYEVRIVKTLGRDRTWLAGEYPLRREMGGG